MKQLHKLKRFFLYSVLCTLFSVLIGCSNKYSAEKLYWQANHTAKEIMQERPLNKLNAQEYQKIIRKFSRVYEKCPLEPQAAPAGFIVAQIYTLQGQYSKAREVLVKITQNFSKNSEVASRAQFMIGNIYEREGNWQQAFSEYEKVSDLFPLTNMGLKTPVYIAEYYKRHKKASDANKAYDKAMKHYQELINEYSGTSVVGVIRDYLALAYVSQGRWDEAVDIWQAIVNEYPQTYVGASSLFAAGETYLRQIRDLQKAIIVYQDFVQRNPDSKIVSYAKFQIGRLYFVKGDFPESRQAFEELIKDYPKEIELLTKSQLAVAACYELEGNWDKAVETYYQLKSNYPDSRAALGIPLFIAQHHLKEHQLQKAEIAFNKAILEYEGIIKENQDSMLAAYAQDFIGLAYISQQKWESAIDALTALVDTYPQNPKASRSLFTIAAIYQRQLKNPQKAIEIYEKFVDLYPRHIWAGLAKTRIESLQ